MCWLLNTIFITVMVIRCYECKVKFMNAVNFLSFLSSAFHILVPGTGFIMQIVQIIHICVHVQNENS